MRYDIRTLLQDHWTDARISLHTSTIVKQWHQKYADKGFVIIGVHSPEFPYEHDYAKVKQYSKEHDIRFPIPSTTTFRCGIAMVTIIGLRCTSSTSEA